MNHNFDARENYGFRGEDAFATFNPINQDEILAYLNNIAEKRGMFDFGPDDADKAEKLRTEILYTCLHKGPTWEFGPGHWYAVLKDDADHNYGKGSYNLAEAKRMVKPYPCGYIAIMDEEGDDLESKEAVCIGELRGEDLI